MSNRSVNLIYRAKTPTGWKYLKPAEGMPGGWCEVGETQSYYPQGTYQLRRYDGSRLVYSPVPVPENSTLDTALSIAQAALRRQSKVLKAAASEQDGRKFLPTAGKLYIAYCAERGANEAKLQAEAVTAEFSKVVYPIVSVAQLTAKDISKFLSALRKRGLSDRTIHNKYTRLRSFLRFCGVDVSRIMPSNDKPRFEKTVPTTYTREQVRQIRAAANPRMKMVIDMAIMFGLREQELMYAEWRDVDWERSLFLVRGKPQYGFKVKDGEQRNVTISASLLESLRQWKEQNPGTTLIVGNDEDKPEGHYLRLLKRLAKKAGLNCGECDGCKGKTNECAEWILHRFRANFITRLHESGVSPRTIMGQAGHSSLETTLRYLSVNKNVQAQFDSISWD